MYEITGNKDKQKGRFPQPTRMFWCTKVGEEEAALSKEPGKQSSSAVNRENLQRLSAGKGSDAPEVHSKLE